MSYSRENDTSNWYVALKKPPRGFHDLEMFNEEAYGIYTPLDVYKLDSIRMSVKNMLEKIVRAH